MPIERQPYLDFLARCNQAFRPFAPIDLPDFFKGRHEQVDLLQRELKTPGRQVAIYGERGVGKTSLADLAYFFAQFDDEASRSMKCEKESTYDTIFEPLFLQAGVGFFPDMREHQSERRGGIGVGPVSGSQARTVRTTDRALSAVRRISPQILLRQFGTQAGLLIIDEYDRVKDQRTHTSLAETLKQFSDADSKTKIIVVGVSETLSELVGEHQSLTRCLAQIQLGRMPDEELAEIIATGEERVLLSFQESVRRKIIALSDGFPFYTHPSASIAQRKRAKFYKRRPAPRSSCRNQSTGTPSTGP